MVKEELNFDLPEDIILQILCRLPVKSLIQFSCVSKRWHSIIISDPQFGKAHLKLASEQRSITTRLILSISPYVQLQTRVNLPLPIQSLEGLFGVNSSVTNLTLPSEEHCRIKILASCNGLVVLGNFYKEYLSIWNPSIGFFRKIPAPDLSSVTIKSRTIQVDKYGFGYVSSTDDYKLVLVVDIGSDDPVPAPDVKIFIFSVRANSWKINEVSRWPFLEYRPTSDCGTLSNEAIHWVNRYYDYDYLEDSIEAVFDVCAFDLENEEFRKVPVPCFNQDDDRVFDRRMRTVVHSGGCLCVLVQTMHNRGGDRGDIELWMMRDYGVSNSWVKLYKLSKYDLPVPHTKSYGWQSWDLSLVTESGSIVIKFDNELLRIECRKEEKPVCVGRYRPEEVSGCYFFNATGYDETLISVPE
ncbi:F-box/kelch-repeat protein At3g23880-like [Rosa chinensis]|uniref:F-box/kelch-repeat protein At3g23880-like n=1 Tax=Rosa chinensis TaxID=74649 RepID=UPI000D090AC5|nr:F-box/kelch-repeat protein At3g23880-like [Rosa chinensis]